MATLYRQYRPQLFAEVSGQEHITSLLEQAVLKDKLSHAYLFQGPRGTGKTTTARILAKRINCQKPKKAEPCGSCSTCKATQANRNMDITEIDAASNRGIDDIRALREKAGLAPTMGKYKVYIIDEVHMLTNEAFAALLKTLEEPVPHVIFILATTELHKVPPTILSRCQVFRFRRAGEQEMKERLAYLLKKEKRNVDDTVLDFVISRSDGCYRDAESLLGQILTTQEKDISLSDIVASLGLPNPETINNFLLALMKNDIAEAIAITDAAYAEGIDVEQFIQESMRATRDGALLLTKGEQKLPAFTQEQNAKNRLPQIIRALVQAMQDVAYVPQPTIALHLAILSVCLPARAATAAPQQNAPAKPSATPAPSPQQQQPGRTFTFSKPTAQSEKKQEAPATQTKPQPVPQDTGILHDAPNTQKEPAAVPLETVTNAWNDIIAKVKETNPVSSTFLRATEASDISGNVMTLQVQFPLHRNFFEKPENKQVVEAAVQAVTGAALSIRCQLNDQSYAAPAPSQQNSPQGQDLLKDVKEVFNIQEK